MKTASGKFRTYTVTDDLLWQCTPDPDGLTALIACIDVQSGRGVMMPIAMAATCSDLVLQLELCMRFHWMVVCETGIRTARFEP